MPNAPAHGSVVSWYRRNSRDLPWRTADRTPWGVLVSEVMLQQTPVNRVEPVWKTWMQRWPQPAGLAAATPADAIRAWGRLGYPRRATRLHQAARTIVTDHDGRVPDSYDKLLVLPGIGDYTAAAVASFAFGQRHVVLDTNVRRVFARVVNGAEFAGPSVSAAERRLAESLLPADGPAAAQWSVAVMELGAEVCTARQPRCDACPINNACAWRLAGAPAYDGPPRRGQAWHGTDRQVRGRIMAVLRAHEHPVDDKAIRTVWPDDEQRQRALRALIADHLVTPTADGRYGLPEGGL